MNRVDQVELKKWIQEHQGSLDSSNYVNARDLRIKIEEMCGEEEKHQTWEPAESDVTETWSVFHRKIEELVGEVNNYWYKGEAKEQSIRLLYNVFKRGLEVK